MCCRWSWGLIANHNLTLRSMRKWAGSSSSRAPEAPRITTRPPRTWRKSTSPCTLTQTSDSFRTTTTPVPDSSNWETDNIGPKVLRAVTGNNTDTFAKIKALHTLWWWFAFRIQKDEEKKQPKSTNLHRGDSLSEQYSLLKLHFVHMHFVYFVLFKHNLRSLFALFKTLFIYVIKHLSRIIFLFMWILFTCSFHCLIKCFYMFSDTLKV